MKRTVIGVAILALALGGSAACATKGYVRTTVSDESTKTNQRVDTLSTSVEDTQQQTRQNAQRIGDVDSKADAAGRSATDARTAAEAVGTRADAIERASKRLVYEVVLSEDQANFKFGRAVLPDEAKMELDKMVEQLKANPQGVFIEIEGHTDSVGGNEINHRIGLQRAEEVKRYLYEQHQIPLHKMNVISYGEEKPIAPNKTRDGRAQNRRVVIKVLA